MYCVCLCVCLLMCFCACRCVRNTCMYLLYTVYTQSFRYAVKHPYAPKWGVGGELKLTVDQAVRCLIEKGPWGNQSSAHRHLEVWLFIMSLLGINTQNIHNIYERDMTLQGWEVNEGFPQSATGCEGMLLWTQAISHSSDRGDDYCWFTTKELWIS